MASGSLHASRMLMGFAVALSVRAASVRGPFRLVLCATAALSLLAACRILSAAAFGTFAGAHTRFCAFSFAAGHVSLGALAMTTSHFALCVLRLTAGHVLAIYGRLLAARTFTRTRGGSVLVGSRWIDGLGCHDCCQRQDESKRFDFHKYLQIDFASGLCPLIVSDCGPRRRRDLDPENGAYLGGTKWGGRMFAHSTCRACLRHAARCRVTQPSLIRVTRSCWNGWKLCRGANGAAAVIRPARQARQCWGGAWLRMQVRTAVLVIMPRSLGLSARGEGHLQHARDQRDRGDTRYDSGRHANQRLDSQAVARQYVTAITRRCALAEQVFKRLS